MCNGLTPYYYYILPQILPDNVKQRSAPQSHLTPKNQRMCYISSRAFYKHFQNPSKKLKWCHLLSQNFFYHHSFFAFSCKNNPMPLERQASSQLLTSKNPQIHICLININNIIIFHNIFSLFCRPILYTWEDILMVQILPLVILS